MPDNNPILYANSKKQLLSHHCALVGLLAEKIVRDTYRSESAEPWAKAAKMAGLLHDIGKIDPKFQAFLQQGECSSSEEQDGTHIEESKKTKGFSFNEYPRHNEVSWALLDGYLDGHLIAKEHFMSNRHLWSSVKYAVYWHHAKPLRDDPDSFTRLRQIQAKLDWLPAHTELLEHLLVEIFHLSSLSKPTTGHSLDLVSLEYTADNTQTPAFKQEYLSVSSSTLAFACRNEARNSAIRSAVVLADRLVSAMSASEVAAWLAQWELTRELPEFVEEEDTDAHGLILRHIQKRLEEFETKEPGSLRNQQQSTAASEMLRSPCTVLQGPAGCGKTKIILEYLSLQPLSPRTFIFVPRTAVGHGLFEELVHEYGIGDHIEFLSSDLKLTARAGNVISTPEGTELSGQIVITTIDQLCSIGLSHRKIDLLTEVMRSTVIFDEFHEIFDTTAIVLIFMEMMYLRSMANAVGTALVSATPNQFFLRKIAEVANASEYEMFGPIVEVTSFNTKPVHLELIQASVGAQGEHPFDHIDTLGEIAVANTATRAQRSALVSLSKKNPTLCFHSKFTARDKRAVFQSVLKSFGKQSDSLQTILFAGPIVQASLNITTRTLHTEAIHAENWLQRLGRVNRFGTFDFGKLITYDLTSKKSETTARQKSTLARLMQWERTAAWLKFLETIAPGLTSLQEIYTLYAKFHRLPEAQESYQKDFDKIIDSSAKVFNEKMFDPVQLPAPKHGNAKKLSANSLRGNSFYVLPLFEHHVKGKLSEQRWLYTDLSQDQDRLTDSLQFLAGLESNKKEEFLNYMGNKGVCALAWTTKLPEGLKTLFKKKRRLKGFHVWLYAARDKNMPLVVSFPGLAGERPGFEQVYLKVEETLIGLIKRTTWSN